ncbi:hypothetical protein [Methylobacterium indicum]|uniref:Uncharacterized protein n=1 Tax=Methylobacterium indicum TaxID=1775910 RepID=A0A8H8X1E5_9HYPH|nr:hypothetical protein [Methylobacterium indicum]BCM87777.1 hypothetical protein mvi_62380 [Methylobacterium indicum]
MKAKKVLTCGENTATVQPDPTGDGYLVRFQIGKADWVLREVILAKAMLYAEEVLRRNTLVVG